MLCTISNTCIPMPFAFLCVLFWTRETQQIEKQCKSNTVDRTNYQAREQASIQSIGYGKSSSSNELNLDVQFCHSLRCQFCGPAQREHLPRWNGLRALIGEWGGSFRSKWGTRDDSLENPMRQQDDSWMRVYKKTSQGQQEREIRFLTMWGSKMITLDYNSV